MAENVPQTVEVPVPLSLFGGLVTEMNPSNLPEGISPDNQDVVYLPGGVSSRPGMRRWLSGLPLGTTVTYVKTFVTPAQVPLNLILTSDGQFWVQNPTVGPFTPTLLGFVTPGSYCSSITAFGKELITFHDGINGTDIPYTYDGQYFDRATQCGPGIPPTLSNTIIPATTLTTTAPGTVALVSCTPANQVFIGPDLYDTTLIVVTATPHGYTTGQTIALAGTSQASYNGFVNTLTVIDATTFSIGFLQLDPGPVAAGGTSAPYASAFLNRTNNTVTGNTSSNHRLQVGYQVQISKVPDTAVGGAITSIVIDNKQNPGVATVTTTTPHGLLPKNTVSLVGIPNTLVGTAIATAVRAGQIVTIATTSAHGLTAGATVAIAGVTDATFDGQFIVLSTPSTSTFTYAQVDADANSTLGTVNLSWIPNQVGLVDSLFTVVSAPTLTTFEIQISYGDGTWTGGSVFFSWNGIFYVTGVLSNTSFQYSQDGPNAVSVNGGTVTPHSQISPGTHQCVVLFQTRTGFITAPSPPISFVANGGQYLTVNNIPQGPSNVVRRILAFTGADGGNFFYIPVPAFVNGIVVSTSTQVEDNTSTSVLLDFSDNTLFASIAIDIPGFNLFQMRVLGPCLGVSSYADRSAWWGMKNIVPNFLNLGFEGGNLSGSLINPCGWTVENAGGILDTIHSEFGVDWLITGTGGGGSMGQISQPAYQDAYGIPIVSPLTKYSMNLRLFRTAVIGPVSGSVHFQFYSPGSTTVLAECVVQASDLSIQGKFVQLDFSAQLPATIPADLQFRIFGFGLGVGTNPVIDEIEIYPTLVPRVPQFIMSYVNLPEQLDQRSGVIGGSDDATFIQTTFEYRSALLFLTQAKLHETNDIANVEPFQWRVREVSNNCGACSPRACSSGENFSVWLTSPSSTPPVGRGLYIYTGGAVYKISQEIQPDFDNINQAFQQASWVQNDSVTRRIYVGVPVASATAPNMVYVLDYREMDSASEIASKSPIHISFSGKMICSDLSRKWTKWNVAGNCGGIVYVPNLGLQFIVGGGNGLIPGTGFGFSNAYWFDPTLFTDNDYGQIVPYYTTYFFVNHEAEQSIGVGLHRKLYKRYATDATGVGQFQLVPYANSLNNPWPAAPAQPLPIDSTYDMGDGLNVSTERCAFKLRSIPFNGQSDNAFTIGRLVITLSQEPVSPVRFGAV
jgi:hypothetical protein